MSEFKDRLRQVRKSMQPKMSQTAFGEMLGYTLDGYKRYELGQVKEIPNSFVKLVCRSTGVSEQWLRDGVGEMRNPDEDEARIEELGSRYNWTPLQREAARIMFKLSDEDLNVCAKAIERFANAAKAADLHKQAADQNDRERQRADAERKMQASIDAAKREYERTLRSIDADGVPAPEPQPPEPNISIDAHDNHIGVNFGGKP